MRAEEVIDQCLYETGARGVSPHAREVALIALLYAPPQNMRDYRRQIRSAFKRSEEYGSVFLLIVLPILVSLISAWINRWLFKTGTTDLRAMKAQAYDELTDVSPQLTATLTSIHTPTI
jgi:hypothetical protein